MQPSPSADTSKPLLPIDLCFKIIHTFHPRIGSNKHICIRPIFIIQLKVHFKASVIYLGYESLIRNANKAVPIASVRLWKPSLQCGIRPESVPFDCLLCKEACSRSSRLQRLADSDKQDNAVANLNCHISTGLPPPYLLAALLHLF